LAYLGPAPQTETRGRGRIWNSCEEAQKTKKIENRSLTSLQQRLVKTGGRLIKHARCYWLTLAESPLTRRLFGGMVVEINQQNGSRRLGRPSPGLGRSLLGIVRKLTDYKKEIEKEKQLEVYYQGPEGP